MAFVFITFFGLFSIYVKKGRFSRLDFDTTVRLQNHTPVRVDKAFSLLSVLASVPIMCGILALTLLFNRKKTGLLVFILFLAGHLVEIFGKLYLHHPPPPFLFYKHLDAAQFDLGKYFVAAGSSYPSGHTYRTVFVGIILLYLIGKARHLSQAWKFLLGLLIFSIIILVGVSRISLGDHWTSDVIGGALFGVSMGTLGVFTLSL